MVLNLNRIVFIPKSPKVMSPFNVFFRLITVQTCTCLIYFS